MHLVQPVREPEHSKQGAVQAVHDPAVYGDVTRAVKICVLAVQEVQSV